MITQPKVDTKPSKQKYLICLDYIRHFVIREFITKPMTEEEFEINIRGKLVVKDFPIIIKGNRKEGIKDAVVWDDFIYTEAMYNDSNIFLTTGVYNASH